MVQIVQHHIKYKEIDGKDEITLMTRGEHTKLHNKLRKEGKWNTLDKNIIKRAYDRTPQGIKKRYFYHKMYMKVYLKNPINKEKYKQYRIKYLSKKENREKEINRSVKYNKNIRELRFYTLLEPKIRLLEGISYNKITKNIGVFSGFYGHGCDLYYIRD